MRKFSQLIESLERAGSETGKIEILKDYFSKSENKDKVWIIYLLTGGKVKSKVKISQLKEWALEYSKIPDWLFEESLKVVGDINETISHIIPAKEEYIDSRTIADWINYIKNFNNKGNFESKEMTIVAWSELRQNEIYIFNKLLTGGLKTYVSQKTVAKALSELEEINSNIITYRLLNNLHPDEISFSEFIKERNELDEILLPYPFAEFKIIEVIHDKLGEPKDWSAEWKYCGIRIQFILRKGELFIWTEDGELVTNKFPELEHAKVLLPDGIVLDGDLICFSKGKHMPVELLTKRISRKNVTKYMMKEAPVVFRINDVLEFDHKDIRSMTFIQRKEVISNLKLKNSSMGCFQFSEKIKFSEWDELQKIREKSADFFTNGIILKKKNMVYSSENIERDWLHWKNDPQKILAVLIYAQKGIENNRDLFCEYTFGVWVKDELVTTVKSNTGLSNCEVEEIDMFVKNNTLEKFGPVRTVTPELVFEIMFERITESKRHKSGVMLHSPKIFKWRKDLMKEDAHSLESLRKFIKQ